MRKFLPLLVLVALSPALRAEPQFIGVLCTAQETYVAFEEPTAGISSGWIKIGQQAGGYTAVAYQPQGDILVLRKQDKSYEIPLRSAVIREQKTKISAEFGFANNSPAGKFTYDLVIGTEQTFPLADGRTLKLKAERLPDGNIKYQATLEQITMAALPASDVARPDTNDAPKEVKRVRRSTVTFAAPEAKTIRTQIGDLSLKLNSSSAAPTELTLPKIEQPNGGK
jgi:hypothetical protein